LAGKTLFFWDENNEQTVFYTYIKTNTIYAIDELEKQLEKASLPILDANQVVKYKVQKLEDIHLGSNLEFELQQGFSKSYLFVIGSTGLLILLVTILNFWSLFNSKYLQKNQIKDVAIRFVIGASRWNIFSIVLSDVLFAFSVSMLFSSLLCFLFIGDIGRFINIAIDYDLLIVSGFYILFLMLIISILMALMMSSRILNHNNVSSLRGRPQSHETKSLGLKTVILYLQLAVTCFVSICIIIVYTQTQMLRGRDMGMNIKDVITLVRPENVSVETWSVLQDKLDNDSKVTSTGQSVFPSIGEYNSQYLENERTNKGIQVSWIGIDEDFIPTMQIQILKGRNFQKNLDTDKTKLILNETAFRLIATDSMFLEKFSFPRMPKGEAEIIGIVADFTFNSVKEKIPPTVLSIGMPRARKNLVVRLSSSLTNLETFNLLNKYYSEVQIDSPPIFNFLEKDFEDKIIKEEQTLLKTITLFCVVALIICALGILSTLTFSLNKRRKELSIRQVFGASFWNNIIHINRHIILIFVISILTSVPLAYFATSFWLSDFVYRIEITSKLIFVPIVSIVVLISLISFATCYSVLNNSLLKFLNEE
jgi:putative ABC transport system permease protein